MGIRDRGTRTVAMLVVVGALLVTGCSVKQKSSTSSSTTTAAPGTTASSPSSEAPDTTAKGSGSDDPWTLDAQSFRGQDGTEHEIECPADGTPDSVWGAGVYSDDSSICTAAVQSGLITFEEGGKVTILIGPAQDSFDAGSANGVDSSDYGHWEGSFTFPDAPPGSIQFATGPESWKRTAADKATDMGSHVTFACSANGAAGSVWGSGPYTADSSVCTAAVHSGLITFEKGGTVVVEIAPGADSYAGTTANGVKTSEYGRFNTSFIFPADLNGD